MMKTPHCATAPRSRRTAAGLRVVTGLRSQISFVFFFQAEDGIRDYKVTGVQTCALPICLECGAANARPPAHHRDGRPDLTRGCDRSLQKVLCRRLAAPRNVERPVARSSEDRKSVV